MRAFILLLAFFGSFAHAADISCQAEKFIITEHGLKDHVVKNLEPINKAPGYLLLQAEIDGRAFTISGDLKYDDYLLSQTWGPDFTSGVSSRATFNDTGRATLSTVEETLVFRLVCVRK